MFELKKAMDNIQRTNDQDDYLKPMSETKDMIRSEANRASEEENSIMT